MAVSIYHIAVDAHDLPRMARFWSAVLDWQVLFEHEEEIIIGAHETALPGMCFLPVPEGKTVKNRLHIDLTPDDQDAEVGQRGQGGVERGADPSGADVDVAQLAGLGGEIGRASCRERVSCCV